MKRPILIVFLATIVFALLNPRPARAEVDFSYFYENLSPYGEWFDVEGYGYCFRPTGVPEDWRPYTDGYWAYTDAGWTWVSYEEFGDITYHYGRWFHLEDAGWLWHPDKEWGPAWVSWRSNETHVGWAPLPPECVYQPTVGISMGVDADYDIGPSSYSFCEVRFFGAPVMRNVIFGRERNVAFIRETTNITNITNVRYDHTTVIFNSGPDYHFMRSRCDRPIQTLVLRRALDAASAGHHGRRVGNELVIPAPVIVHTAKIAPPAHVVRTVAAPRIDKGWGTVRDPQVRNQLHQHIAKQVQGIPVNQRGPTAVDPRAVRAVISGAASRQNEPGLLNPGRRLTPVETHHAAPNGDVRIVPKTVNVPVESHRANPNADVRIVPKTVHESVETHHANPNADVRIVPKTVHAPVETHHANPNADVRIVPKTVHAPVETHHANPNADVRIVPKTVHAPVETHHAAPVSQHQEIRIQQHQGTPSSGSSDGGRSDDRKKKKSD